MDRATIRSGVRSLFVSIVKQPEKIQSELLRHLVHVYLHREPDWIFVRQQPILHLIEVPQIIIIALATTHRVVSKGKLRRLVDQKLLKGGNEGGLRRVRMGEGGGSSGGR